MPKLPNLFEGLPKHLKLPRVSKLLGGNPVREVIKDARELIKSGREEISNVASAIRVEGKPPVETPPEEISSPVAKGTACLPCSRDHLSTTSSALSEGIRFARDKGVKDHEVMRRIRIGLDELNAMERIDLAPEETAKLKGAEKKLADWTLRQSRELRHTITAIRDADTLAQAAARASSISVEFMNRLWAIPEEECETCGKLRDRLKEFIEKRKGERTQEPAITLEEAKKLAAEGATKELEKRWQSQEKKSAK